ncbi:matrixin family metalloprotease [Streptomyces sp. NPDC017936]|uniref:matrixin family metalloprotease n=1 Tax=Streptomyces sp. NPDC017936 TaxID=3365016 RepID=UPI0037925556
MAGRHGPGLLARVIAAGVLAVSGATLADGDAPPRAQGDCGPARGALTVDDLPAGSSALRCAAVGRLVVHAGTGVAVPEPGMKVSVDSLSADGSRHGFSVEVAADGTVSYGLETGAGSAEHARPAAPRATAAARTAARAACADTAHAVSEHKEYGTYDWWLGDDALPGNLSPSAARRAFESAIATITGTRNDCGYGDVVGARAKFHSQTFHEADIDHRARCSARDGVSVWDAGDLGPGVVATTCTWSRTVAGGAPDWLKEADVRFNTGHYAFTDNPTANCKNTYDIRSVATHEAGHVFGLAHVGAGHENQTMFTNSFACSTGARTLGRGDVLGLRRLY